MNSDDNSEGSDGKKLEPNSKADCSSSSESPHIDITTNRSINNPHQDLIFPPSPPKFVSMSQLTEAAEAFYNMSLAHEITVDSDFKLEKYEPSQESLEYSIKESMHRAFWDILRSSLELQPPDYRPSLQLLAEVKRSLECLVLPHQTTLHKLIESSLDLEIAQSQLEETGRLSLETYADQVINLMKTFCAPIRDAEVESLRKITDPVEAFRNVFVLLEKMHMDLANFTIAQMRPYIRQQAVTYERKKFATFLEAQQKLGIDGLASTRGWIKKAYEQLETMSNEESPPKDPPNSFLPTSSNFSVDKNRHSLTPNNVLREAFLLLLSWPAVVTEWPETMMMDQNRLVELRNQLVIIVYLTSFVLVICNYVASNITTLFSISLQIGLQKDHILKLKQSICQEAVNLLRNVIPSNERDQLCTLLPEHIILVVEFWYNQLLDYTYKDSNSAHISSNVAVLSDKAKPELTKQIVDVIRCQHPVYKLMYKRALDFLRSALSSYPPEPLPLPPGFSILLDVEKPILNSEPDDVQLRSQTTIPVCLAYGHINSSTPIKPNKEANMRETLSLSVLAGRLLPLLSHNRHVFGPQYAEIIHDLIMPNGVAEPDNQPTG